MSYRAPLVMLPTLSVLLLAGCQVDEDPLPATAEIRVSRNLLRFNSGASEGTASQLNITIPSGRSSTVAFLLENLGGINLTVVPAVNTGATVVNISGSPVFSVGVGSIPSLMSTTMTVVFTPTADGVWKLPISINTNDTTPGEDPFVFSIGGLASPSSATVSSKIIVAN